MKTAILVDGGFYRRRAYAAFGDKTPKERADELYSYCKRHLNTHGESNELYRIFYYDCPPMTAQIYHPLTKKAVNFAKSDTYTWANDFFNELKKKRKVALRMGELSEQQAHYRLKNNILNKLMRGDISVSDIKERDFLFNVEQKGVDMRIGLDIASLSYKKQVNQILFPEIVILYLQQNLLVEKASILYLMRFTQTLNQTFSNTSMVYAHVITHLDQKQNKQKPLLRQQERFPP